MAQTTKMVEGAVYSVIGALVTSEVITAVGYSGAGSGLIDLFPLLVAAGGMLVTIGYFN